MIAVTVKLVEILKHKKKLFSWLPFYLLPIFQSSPTRVAGTKNGQRF
jgi:hypothetical protein